METEDRINAIEAELQQTKDDLKEIISDILNYLSAMHGHVPDDEPAEPKGKRG